MEIQVKTAIGGVEFTFNIDENKEMEALHKAIVLGSPPNYCNECKNNQHFRMDSNKDKDGNVYVNVVCRKCGAKAKLGLYKAGGFFWHKFEKYQKEGADNTPATPGVMNSDGLPF
jgi:hypothetical protein